MTTKPKALSQMSDAFRQFSRNGRWGTCAACPRNGEGAFPEFCEHTDRSDHHLTVDGLAEQWRFHSNGLAKIDG